MNERKTGVTRRTVMKGAVWSVPVVAVAAAVPARAASGEGVIGQFHESSAQITSASVNLAGFYVECSDTTPPLCLGEPFTATITVTYTGSNPDFTFVPTINNSTGWSMQLTPTRITLTTTVIPNGCGQGSSYFPGISLVFNGGNPGAPNAEPGPASIEVQGIAVSESGDCTISGLIDATPCSPTFGQTPIVGPRDIPPSC